MRVDTARRRGRLAWRDQERLRAIGVRDLDSVVLDVDAKTDTATERWATEEACGVLFIAAAPVGEGFGLVLQSATRPPEIVLVDEDGTERTVVHTTHRGTDLIRSSIGSRTRLSWEAPDGLPISGLLTVPAGDPPFPLILTVHGGPVWAYQDFWPGPFGALLATRGYATLMANPRGSWGRGRDFAARVVGDMGGADAQDLLAGVDRVVSLGIADPDRLGITGGSYGGFMSAWLPCIDPRFRAAAALSPVTDWYSERFDSNLGTWTADFLGGDPVTREAHYRERSPVFAAGWNRTPTLLTAGSRDRATPTGQAIEFHHASGSTVFDGRDRHPLEGHGVRDLPAGIDLATRLVAWFEGTCRRARALDSLWRMTTREDLEQLSTKSSTTAPSSGQAPLDVGFLWELVKALPVAEEVVGDDERSKIDIARPLALIDDVLYDSDSGKLGDALRPLYIDYLEEHDG